MSGQALVDELRKELANARGLSEMRRMDMVALEAQVAKERRRAERAEAQIPALIRMGNDRADERDAAEQKSAELAAVKRECPACSAWTSAVGQAFMDGDPCPYCGLPADAAELIDQARERKVSDDVLQRLANAEVRANNAEAEATKLRNALREIRRITEGTAKS